MWPFVRTTMVAYECICARYVCTWILLRFSHFVSARWKEREKEPREENWLASSQWRVGLRRRPWDPLFRIGFLEQNLRKDKCLPARSCVSYMRHIFTFSTCTATRIVERGKACKKIKEKKKITATEKGRKDVDPVITAEYFPLFISFARCIDARASRRIPHARLDRMDWIVHQRRINDTQIRGPTWVTIIIIKQSVFILHGKLLWICTYTHAHTYILYIYPYYSRHVCTHPPVAPPCLPLHAERPTHMRAHNVHACIYVGQPFPEGTTSPSSRE